MAERQGTSSCSEEQIQSMVRNIFGELLEAGQSQQTGNSSGQHTSVASEINQRFRLPRNVRQTQNVNLIPTRPSVNTITDSNFSPSDSRQCSPPALNMPHTLSAAVPSFNANLNYGNLNRPNVARSGPVRPRRSENRRHSVCRRNERGSNSQSSSTSERNEIFMKDVCVLPQGCDKIPRREAKAKLQREGCYVDAFMFDKRWDEQTLRMKILPLFASVLDSEKRYLIS